MENHRITIRIPQYDLHSIDLFIRAGEFSSRSEVIRRAVNDFVKAYANQVIEKADKTRKMQDLEFAVETINPITYKNNV
jgi:Arc/MetJ-type ribon-helix-helix transcriptional regulator